MTPASPHHQQSASRLRCVFAAWLCVALALPGIAASEQHRWSGVERVVAVSDPHGAYDALLSTLRNAAVIDDTGHWAGGSTHLVITGDMLDRGADSRKVMDLVMALENEAPESGGMVHLTLGNHEVMNLVGDLRYVAAGEYAAFAGDEPPQERERWFEIFSSGRQGEDESALRAEFDKSRPAGFYAHRQAFSSDGHYGKWLLSKPVIVVINDTAYVHGGLPESVAKFDLQRLNADLRSQVNTYVKQSEFLFAAGLLDPAVNFYERPAIAEQIAMNAQASDEIVAATQAVIELSSAGVHGDQSPLWYRGTVGCSTLLEDDTLVAALQAIDAKRVVIGHTPTVTRRVLQRHGGRVIEIDTGMLNAAYHGSGFALVLNGEDISVVSERGGDAMLPADHPRRVGIRPHHLSLEQLEGVLRNGSIAARKTDTTGQDVVEIAYAEGNVAAIFTPNPRNRDFSAPLAAYRLDRLLGLEMVPVTVAREIDGKRGALQFFPQGTRDESERAASGRGADAWCSLQKQWNAMYIFDALAYNKGRPQTGMRYSVDNWQLILSGNENMFDSKPSKPAYLAQAPLDYGDSWKAALMSLSDETLAKNFSDVLDKRRLQALTKRRDFLLKEAETR